jgi:mono/diheme cytochrome c family protein
MNGIIALTASRGRLRLAGASLSILGLAACAEADGAERPAASDRAPHVQAASDIEAGRYLVTTGGCNDCHTKGWDVAADATPESAWLTGTEVGWQGPWGTTYPSNLRLLVDGLSEEAFVEMLRTRKDRPPMPWMNVNRMHEADARSIYRFIKWLGPAGKQAPQALPPGEKPRTAFIPMAPPTTLAAAD